ncbi:MAG: DNA recombination protein RadA [Nitrospira sp. OLB3]|nr:MAG: DNA recombination protein RadA [Nitrospira sp. OLB3]MCE7964388.1 DNA repair protein RadA [Nitrospira sp. NTP2]
MKTKTTFSCQACGYQAPRWLGRCPDCSGWNTFKEERVVSPQKGRPLAGNVTAATPVPITDIEIVGEPRSSTGLAEFDRVLGGGIVPGSVILIGGDPGIGKTTLLLQALPRLAGTSDQVLYVSGEESTRQIKMRCERLGIVDKALLILGETSLEQILRAIQDVKPVAVVVDSIQTVYTEQITSAPGSISQVQEVAGQLMWFAKRSNVPVFIIGHVTKEGAIAGPRLLEHIVDTVLYFEGDKSHSYRILRAVKNRFGSTNEIGMFEMKEGGLEEIDNPSELFLAERPQRTTGSVVVSSLEGTRPILVELQALVSATSYAMPKRMANGVEPNRLSLLLAVMEKRLGMHLSGQDVYINVVGGIHIDEPAIDLGIVTAVTSSLREQPIDFATLVMGEVGLGGEVRAISQAELRIREAAKMGFKRCLLPERNVAKLEPIEGIELIGVHEVGDALDAVLA